MKSASGMLAFWASAATALPRSGPIVPLAPATVSVWQLPHPFEEKTCLPSAIAAAFPPDDDPPLDGVDVGVDEGVDEADERAAVETVGFSPTELALLVVLPAATITTTITTMPT